MFPCVPKKKGTRSKLGLAAFLLVVEFLLARFTGLDMSRFMAWNVSNQAVDLVKTLNPVAPHAFSFFFFLPSTRQQTQTRRYFLVFEFQYFQFALQFFDDRLVLCFRRVQEVLRFFEFVPRCAEGAQLAVGRG